MRKNGRKLKALDDLLFVRRLSGNGGKRRIRRNGKRRDVVSRLLAKCQSASEMAELAVKFGMNPHEVMRRAKSAPNFGQFRMSIGNCIRGVISREVFQRHRNHIRSKKTSKG